jgi:hypothetical protein
MNNFISDTKKKYLQNDYFYNGIIIILLLFLFLNSILDTTIWGVIKKVLLFENNLSAREYILEKKFPLFSFTQNMGFPILAESQAGIFEPINLITNLFFGPLNQINASFFIHLIIFYSGIFLLSNKIYKIEKNISFAVSIICVFSTINFSDSVHQFHLASISYLPISIFFIEKYLFHNKFLLFFLLFSLTIFFMLLAGHYQYQLYCLIILGIYVLISFIFNYKEKLQIKILFIFFISCFFGFVLASFQLLPSLDLMLLGDRSNFHSTFAGSLGYSGIFVFYKSLSKEFNWVEGSVSTIGYISIFIYSINQILELSKTKNLKIDKNFFTLIIIFIICFLLSLGQNLSANNSIYKLVPFLQSFRFPGRMMQVASICTIFLFAISFNKIFSTKDPIKNLKIIFLIIFFIYLFPLFHFWKYMSKQGIDIYYWRHAIFVFYPFIIIVGFYFFLKYIKNLIPMRMTIFFIIIFSLLENFGLLNAHQQYSLIFSKQKIIHSQNHGTELCIKYNVKSLNIVGELLDTEQDLILNYKKFNYYSPISYDQCRIFYHHRREDITKIGLGYSQSSLATFQMQFLSELQENLITQKYEDYRKNRFKYTASFMQEFTNSKVLYADEKTNLIKDDLIKINEYEIYNFINQYNFIQNLSIIEIIKNKYNKELLHLLNQLNIKEYFPNVSSNKIKIINIDNNKFLPLWQSNDFYYTKNNQLYNLEKFSFGYKIKDNINNFKIYYIPFSFIIGLLITIMSIMIWFFFLLLFSIRVKK